jgi:acylphosphatase
MSRTSVRLIVRGRVQGVGYRWWAAREAQRLGLDGWVRNRRDGAVELVAAGAAEAVEALVEACWRGPESARVTAIDRLETEDQPPHGFEERPTA